MADATVVQERGDTRRIFFGGSSVSLGVDDIERVADLRISADGVAASTRALVRGLRESAHELAEGAEHELLDALAGVELLLGIEALLRSAPARQ